jgi:hypothetical protein
LDDIEVQLASTGLPSESAELADRHRYLSSAIVEAAAPALREGHALLERVGRDEPGAQGVVSVVGIQQTPSRDGFRLALVCGQLFNDSLAADSVLVFALIFAVLHRESEASFHFSDHQFDSSSGFS